MSSWNISASLRGVSVTENRPQLMHSRRTELVPNAATFLDASVCCGIQGHCCADAGCVCELARGILHNRLDDARQLHMLMG